MYDKAIELLKLINNHLKNNLPSCPFPQRDIIYPIFLTNGALKEEFISKFPIEKVNDYFHILRFMANATGSSGYAPNDIIISNGYGQIERKNLIKKIDEIIKEFDEDNNNFCVVPTRELDEDYDIFISHASEDKEAIARPLAKALLRRRYNVFLDELVIKMGDSITESINKGLSKAKYGIVIISPTFLHKNWTKAELNSLANMYVSANKKILPIWHHISYEDIVNQIPLIADLKAVDSSEGLDYIVEEIIKVIGASTHKSYLKTNYNWTFYDFSESVQMSICKHLISSLTDVDIIDYHRSLEEADLFLSSIDTTKISDLVANKLRELMVELKKLIIEDINNLINDR